MNNKNLELVNYLRGYSIFAIVLFHLLLPFPLPQYIGKAVNFGGAGVHVFILCSGFGLYLSHLHKPLGFWLFIRKRFYKIYTPYIIVIFISFLVPFMYNENNRILALLSNVFLFKMFDEQFVNSFGVQFWFISMIIQFYLVFPFLAKWIYPSKLFFQISIVLFVSFGWAIIVSLLGKSEVRVWNSFFLQYLWEFVIGMELAKYYFKNQSFKLPSKFYLIIISVIGIALAGYLGTMGGNFKLFNDIPMLFGYLSLSLLIYSFAIKQINSFFLYTNKFGYEWYLIHILIFTCTFKFLENCFHSVLIGLVALVLSYIFAIIYHKIVKLLIK